MKTFFKILIFAHLISCTSSTPKRTISSDVIIPINHLSTDPSGVLALPPFQCPEGTSLESAVIEVNLSRCLKEYIHREVSHGITRERICFHTGTKHESRMRMGQKNKIYAALVKKIQFPIAQKEAHVSLNLNHAYYSLEWKTDTKDPSLQEAPTKKEVLQAFRDTPLPKKVSLERCECDLTQISNEHCLQQIGPLLQQEQVYRFVTNPEDLIF